MKGPWKEEVRAIHARMDAEVTAWQQAYAAGGGKIHCGRGCVNCCRLAVEATYPEALAAAEAFSGDQLSSLEGWVGGLKEMLMGSTDLKDYLRLYRQRMAGCPFVEEDGACGIYGVRPLACRALLSTRNPDWCGIDLGALHPLERQAFLSSLDPSVVAWPTHYAAAPQDAGRELEAEISLRMAQLYGFSLSGNFPYLVWLIVKRDLGMMVLRGEESVRALLREEGVPSFLARIGI